MAFDLNDKRRGLRSATAQRDDDGRAYQALERLAEKMARTNHDRDAPVREVMARLGDRWSSLLLVILDAGTFRHAELRRLVSILASEQTISQRMLTLRLRALERDGLVARTVTPTVPPRTDYALTPLGRQLKERLEGLIDWIGEKESEIRAARADFERQS